MFTQRNINLLVQILLIAGALNWGAVAFGKDVVTTIVGTGQVDRLIKIVIACAGAYHAYMVYNAYTKQA